MAMVSLKRTPEEIKRDKKEFSTEIEQPSFPASLHLGTDEVEKLGLSDVEVEDEKILTAKVKVTDHSVHQRQGGPKRRSLTFAIMEAEVSDTGSKKSQEDRMFPKKG